MQPVYQWFCIPRPILMMCATSSNWQGFAFMIDAGEGSICLTKQWVLEINKPIYSTHTHTHIYIYIGPTKFIYFSFKMLKLSYCMQCMYLHASYMGDGWSLAIIMQMDPSTAQIMRAIPADVAHIGIGLGIRSHWCTGCINCLIPVLFTAT